MKKWCLIVLIFISLLCMRTEVKAQCSICTKTAQQLGEKTGKGLNSGILYLAAAPLMIIGFIGYRWWKSNENNNE
jgi:hypothetical protein